MAESALIVRVREAQPLVGKLRDQFDSSAKLGVPAHITVLYPFMPPERITAAVLEEVSHAISGAQPFEFRLACVKRFPGVLYLAPEPSAPFVDLTNRIARQFPEFPPYEGRFQPVVPHLTVADGGDSQASDAEAQLLVIMREHGPVFAKCASVVLIDNFSGLWREKCEISLVA
jgi:2'-5' RNA ligase